MILTPISELCDILCVTRTAVTDWQKSGLQSKKHNGKRMVDLRVVADWLATKGKGPLAIKLYKYLDPQKVERAEKKVAAKLTEGIPGMLERARQSEIECWREYMNCEPTMKSYWLEQHRASCEQRRKVEKDFASIGQSQGNSISIDKIEAANRECAEVIQSDLFGALPAQCATAIAGKKMTSEQVRSEVLKIVDGIVSSWINAEIIPTESKK